MKDKVVTVKDIYTEKPDVKDKTHFDGLGGDSIVYKTVFNDIRMGFVYAYL